MSWIEWDVCNDGTGKTLFTINNCEYDDLYNYLLTIERYINQFGPSTYSIQYYIINQCDNSNEKELIVYTDFYYSIFQIMNPDWTTAIQKKIE